MNGTLRISEACSSRKRTLTLLDEIQKSSSTGSCAYVAPSFSLKRGSADILDNVDLSLPADIAPIAIKSTNGYILFRQIAPESKDCLYTLIVPPFPVSSTSVLDYLDTGILKKQLLYNYTISVLLLRLGNYAIAITSGEDILISKTGTGNIHSRHRQGGSSQARFARHREKQIETFFTRVCEHCRQTFEPYQCGIDYLALGGARNTLNDFFKQCGYLNTIKAPQFKPAYDIPSPNRRVLQEFIHHIWSSKIYQWKTVNNAINT